MSIDRPRTGAAATHRNRTVSTAPGLDSRTAATAGPPAARAAGTRPPAAARAAGTRPPAEARAAGSGARAKPAPAPAALVRVDDPIAIDSGLSHTLIGHPGTRPTDAIGAPSSAAFRAAAVGLRATVAPEPGAGAPETIDIELDAIDPAATVELTLAEIAAIIADAEADPALIARPAPARPARAPAAAPEPPVTVPGPHLLTAPGPVANAVDPGSIWWSDRRPAATATATTTMITRPHSASWRLPRPPRLGLIVFYLVASLCCGLLAPFCWAVASSELGGIRRGTVEDRHRGLLTAAVLWGAFASCLLVVAFFCALSLVARTAIHP